MQNVIDLGNGQLLTVNFTVLLIVFIFTFIVLVITLLFISANISNIAKTLDRMSEGRGPKEN